MAKLQTVAGLISEVLVLDPIAVQQHVDGLRAAERWEGDDLGAVEVADLLSACLNLDRKDATGAFHLPFAGAIVGESDYSWAIDRQEPMFERLDIPFGGMVAEVLHELSSRDLWASAAVRSVSTFMHGSQQLAAIVLDGSVLKIPGGTGWFFYGHDFLPVVADTLFAQSSLLKSSSVGGAVLGQLAEHLRGASVSLPLTSSVPLDRARAH